MILISRDRQIRYLLKETRYTREELEALPDETIELWYKEERECNKES